jgi:hypothetical protein
MPRIVESILRVPALELRCRLPEWGCKVLIQLLRAAGQDGTRFCEYPKSSRIVDKRLSIVFSYLLT